eukprot:CAMPEP_0170445426 /NCGR_PEP_ID=MMETSP0117_2-20130122/49058_1 /TAXON_ID=400756 /ORGANISM="Durinskia baltica, Strain CSIRO CS-38" /LENGTH=346 /DNA_ID=CAMNT_0010706307 /DNA_START=29 /DNA_END=1069 /DNA_ORIENTATION=+
MMRFPVSQLQVLNSRVSSMSRMTSAKLHFAHKTGSIRRPLPNQLTIARHFSSPNRGNGDDDGNKKMGMMASAGLGLSVLAGKTKYLLVGLKLTKAAPAASMLLTSFAYSFFFGWPYAVGMVGLIFFHECGHALVMRRYGVPFSPMVFVPFMGAVIAMKDEPRNAYEEAMIAFGGPVLGSAAALGCATVGAMNESQLLIALADFGYMVNLFNLLPIGSMDGGRITGAVSPYFGALGVAAGGALIYEGLVHNPLFYIIMLMGTYSTASRLFGWEERANKNYYKIPGSQQGVILVGYAGLIAALVVAMKENDKNRKTPKQLEREKEYGENVWSIGTGQQGDGVYDDYFK